MSRDHRGVLILPAEAGLDSHPDSQIRQSHRSAIQAYLGPVRYVEGDVVHPFRRVNDQVTALDVYAGDRACDSDERAFGSAVASSRNAESFKGADIEYDLRRHTRLKPSNAGPLAVDCDSR